MKTMMVILVCLFPLCGLFSLLSSGYSKDVLQSASESRIHFGNDSLKLISELYKGAKIFAAKEYSDFSYTVNYDWEKKIVTIISSNQLAGNKIDYIILLKDVESQFNKSQFSPADDSYEYIDSYFRINEDRIDLGALSLANLPGEKVTPTLLWYGPEFGISAKYYRIKGKEFFLLRGLDLYCNGSQCTGYYLFVIQKKDRDFKAEVFYFSGLYPYNFENTFLFDNKNDGIPEIFLTKDVDELKSLSDFEAYILDF